MDLIDKDLHSFVTTVLTVVEEDDCESTTKSKQMIIRKKYFYRQNRGLHIKLTTRFCDFTLL